MLHCHTNVFNITSNLQTNIVKRCHVIYCGISELIGLQGRLRPCQYISVVNLCCWKLVLSLSPLEGEHQRWQFWGRPSCRSQCRVKQKIFLKTRFQPHCNGGRGPILTWAFSSSWQQSAQPEDNGSLVLLNHLNSEQRVIVVQFISLSVYQVIYMPEYDGPLVLLHNLQDTIFISNKAEGTSYTAPSV